MRTDVDWCTRLHTGAVRYGHRERVRTAGSRLPEKKSLPHLRLEPESVSRLAFQSSLPGERLFPVLLLLVDVYRSGQASYRWSAELSGPGESGKWSGVLCRSRDTVSTDAMRAV